MLWSDIRNFSYKPGAHLKKRRNRSESPGLRCLGTGIRHLSIKDAWLILRLWCTIRLPAAPWALAWRANLFFMLILYRQVRLWFLLLVQFHAVREERLRAVFCTSLQMEWNKRLFRPLRGRSGQRGCFYLHYENPLQRHALAARCQHGGYGEKVRVCDTLPPKPRPSQPQRFTAETQLVSSPSDGWLLRRWLKTPTSQDSESQAVPHPSLQGWMR